MADSYRQREWIPVEEILPRETGEYLVLDKNQEIYIAFYFVVNERIEGEIYLEGWIEKGHIDGRPFDLNDHVTHWDMLPILGAR